MDQVSSRLVLLVELDIPHRYKLNGINCIFFSYFLNKIICESTNLFPLQRLYFFS